MFCINVDIDGVLLWNRNKGLGVISFTVIPLCNSWNGILVSASYLAK